MERVLVVEDEPGMRRILASNLQRERYEVIEASGFAEARRALAETELDAVIADQKLGDGEGLDVLAAARDVDPALSVVFLTAYATIELAVESMRRGAFDFVTKPFKTGALLASIARAVEHTKLLRENERLRETVLKLEGSSEIVGDSAAIRKLREQIARVAPTGASVLITGETGTGKELVARAIHRSSARSAQPFVAVNCAAFTETLLESELFGHERGAFTGASHAREGVFEAAHEGTLFLDEVSEMSPAGQAKLLRVLTDGLVMRIGSTKPRQVDVRMICATNRDLQRGVQAGLFRSDLYYRLAVVPLAVPPLRERREDIAQLCAQFLTQATLELKVPPRKIAADGMRALMAYDFPGNVRELRNLVERACILARGEEITATGFPVSTLDNSQCIPSTRAVKVSSATEVADLISETPDLREFLTSLEKALIERSLRLTGGAQAEAARRLGLSRSDLSYKLTKHRIRSEINENKELHGSDSSERS